MTTAPAKLPQNIPRPLRLALAFQSSPATLPSVPEDVDDTLLRYLPDSAAIPPASSATTTSRASLVPALLDFSPQQGAGTSLTYRFVTPEKGLSRCEQVFYEQLGVACVRAVVFLRAWLKLRYFMAAADQAGVDFGTLNRFREASPLFKATYDAIELAIRANRHAQTEDTLHKLSNGEIEATKEVLDKDGNKVTLSQGKIYDAKLVALALAAGDPARYGAASGKTGAQVTVSVVMEVPRPERAERVVDVASADPESTPIDVDFVEA